MDHVPALTPLDDMGELLHFMIHLLKSVFLAHLNLTHIKVILLSHGLNIWGRLKNCEKRLCLSVRQTVRSSFAPNGRT
jgi:hypothetical protein